MWAVSHQHSAELWCRTAGVQARGCLCQAAASCWPQVLPSHVTVVATVQTLLLLGLAALLHAQPAAPAEQIVHAACS